MPSANALDRVSAFAGRSPARAAAALIAAFLLFHLALAATLGLGVDESYSIGVAHDLNLFYFDHPPAHYWIAHLFMPLFGDGRALRLPFIAMFAATSWLLFAWTRQLFGAAAGLWALLALNLSAFFTLAGGWVVPDGPLLLSLTAAAFTISRALFADGAPPSPWRTWLAAGLWIGVAGLSKYHAVLFVAGLLIYMASSSKQRTLLRHPAPWAGAAVALALTAPVIVANAEHHFASFAFQGGRALGVGSFPKIGQFLLGIGGQALWMLPWIFVPMVIAAFEALRRGRADDRSWYCLCLGLPTIAVFTLIPLWGGGGLPHWPMPGWLMLYPLLGAHLAAEAAIRRRPRTWAVTSAALLLALSVLFVGHAATGYGRALMPAAAAKNDPTLESFEWTPLAGELRRRGLLDVNGLFVVATNMIDMAKIDQALHDTLPTQIFGESKQYAFRYDANALVGHDALIIGRRDKIGAAEPALVPYFRSIEELPSFAFGRSGVSEVELRIFYAHALQKPLPSPYGNGAPAASR
jgi:4-amino-4-deoxy-L-arabinose transferase-like glycosyltransferase